MIFLASIAVPVLMIYVQNKWAHYRAAFNAAALIAGLIFGNIAAISVYKIIRDHIVFMTTIHAVFLNPFFLATGAYLGVFFLYRLLLLTIPEFAEEKVK
ncbi:transposase [Cohnella endophytica]|uniref:Transposase n=1 Tax=Cohnella endophytica TaxID=2419778 RepID=A0A494YAV7_9BACL|nr:transposase [Cohnella endophytica]RKP57418.1 transposase [Cohnella endophytica]